MEQSSDIRLELDATELDVIEGKETGRTPLSDLYGYPVFGTDTEQKAGERRTKERQMLKMVRREVFAVEEQGTEERLWGIRSQIFQDTTQQESLVLTAFGQDAAEVSAAEIWMLLGITAAGVLLVLLAKGITCRRKKEIRGQNNDADIDCRLKTTGCYGEAWAKNPGDLSEASQSRLLFAGLLW